jgi:SagB-type dehydrogenase family enzyme
LKKGPVRREVLRYALGQEHVGTASAVFFMTAAFPRTMYKYRSPRAYRIVTLETGHLAQTFCLVATWLGLAPFTTAAVADTAIEDALGLDGVTESMMYVAGVGMPLAANALAAASTRRRTSPSRTRPTRRR